MGPSIGRDKNRASHETRSSFFRILAILCQRRERKKGNALVGYVFIISLLSGFQGVSYTVHGVEISSKIQTCSGSEMKDYLRLFTKLLQREACLIEPKGILANVALWRLWAMNG